MLLLNRTGPAILIIVNADLPVKEKYIYDNILFLVLIERENFWISAVV